MWQAKHKIKMIKLRVLTIATPSLSARVIYTQNVATITEVNGAIADTQNNLGYFLACANIKEKFHNNENDLI